MKLTLRSFLLFQLLIALLAAGSEPLSNPNQTGRFFADLPTIGWHGAWFLFSKDMGVVAIESRNVPPGYVRGQLLIVYLYPQPSLSGRLIRK